MTDKAVRTDVACVVGCGERDTDDGSARSRRTGESTLSAALPNIQAALRCTCTEPGLGSDFHVGVREILLCKVVAMLLLPDRDRLPSLGTAEPLSKPVQALGVDAKVEKAQSRRGAHVEHAARHYEKLDVVNVAGNARLELH
eukprot:2733138-Prymnesium_polylepis.1